MKRDRDKIRPDVVTQLLNGKLAASDARYVERMEAVRILRIDDVPVRDIAYQLYTTPRAVYRYSAAVREAGWE